MKPEQCPGPTMNGWMYGERTHFGEAEEISLAAARLTIPRKPGDCRRDGGNLGRRQSGVYDRIPVAKNLLVCRVHDG